MGKKKAKRKANARFISTGYEVDLDAGFDGGVINKSATGEWLWGMPLEPTELGAEELRAIADKLDELNGQ